jgi:hypothetical protein
MFSTTWGICFRSSDNSKLSDTTGLGTVLGQCQSASWLVAGTRNPAGHT